MTIDNNSTDPIPITVEEPVSLNHMLFLIEKRQRETKLNVRETNAARRMLRLIVQQLDCDVHNVSVEKWDTFAREKRFHEFWGVMPEDLMAATPDPTVVDVIMTSDEWDRYWQRAENRRQRRSRTGAQPAGVSLAA